MNKSTEVEAWLQRYDNPQKATVMAVRDLLLAADPRLAECIKWQSPTFVFNGNLASFNPRAKRFASLLFHTGAQIPGDFPHLEGGAGTARFMKTPEHERTRAVSTSWSRRGTKLAGPGVVSGDQHGELC